MNQKYFDTVAGYIQTWLAEVGEEIRQATERLNAAIEVNADDNALNALNRRLKAAEDVQRDLLRCQVKLNTPPKGMKKAERLDPEDTFAGYCRRLNDDPAFREDESFRAEVERIAADKATALLMQQHKYIDGSYDAPLLNAETMMLMREQERKEYRRELENEAAAELEREIANANNHQH